jgi:hypothetical protein
MLSRVRILASRRVQPSSRCASIQARASTPRSIVRPTSAAHAPSCPHDAPTRSAHSQTHSPSASSATLPSSDAATPAGAVYPFLTRSGYGAFLTALEARVGHRFARADLVSHLIFHTPAMHHLSFLGSGLLRFYVVRSAPAAAGEGEQRCAHAATDRGVRAVEARTRSDH